MNKIHNRLLQLTSLYLKKLACTLLAVAALSFAAPGLAQARPLQCPDLAQLFQYYLRNHYAFHKMTDQIRSRTVEQFIKLLDPSKTYLLDGDVEVLRKDLTNVFSETDQANCASLDKAQQLMVQRMNESKGFVDKFLGPDYKFDENAELVLNPDLRGYSKTSDERNTYLAKLTHFNVSSYLLTDAKLEDAKHHIKKRYELTLKRLNDRNTSQVLDLWAEAFSRALDPHSSYMSQDVLEDFQIQMQLSLEGIGASLTSEDGYTVIEELIPGGAADKSKQLKPKDKIIAVAQDGKPPVDVMDQDLRDVVKLIRGKKGTKVNLTILRQGEKTESFKLTLVRDKVDLKEQAAKITYEKRTVDGHNYKLGVIDLPSFYGGGKGEGRSCYQDVKDLLHQARIAKADGLILDLSRNGGGLLDQAVQIGGLFIKKGGIVATKSTDGRVEVLDDQDPDTQWSGPLIVLTSRLSASASEILGRSAQGLSPRRDHRRGPQLRQGHRAGARAPAGQPWGDEGDHRDVLHPERDLHHLGVASDINLPSPLNSEDYGEKKLDYSLDQQKIDNFVSKDADSDDAAQHWLPIDHATVTKLNEKTQARVSKSDKFAQVKKELDEALKNKGIIKLAEIRKKANEDKKSGKAETTKKKGKKSESEEDAYFLQESENILVDLIETQGPRLATHVQAE